MNSTKKSARIAGLLYRVNGVTGFLAVHPRASGPPKLRTRRRTPSVNLPHSALSVVHHVDDVASHRESGRTVNVSL
jgi:hypothetical protein